MKPTQENPANHQMQVADNNAKIDKYVEEVLSSTTPFRCPPKLSSILSDTALVAELRNRGYEVKATKTIEL